MENKNKFAYGFFASIIGWIISSVTITIIMGIVFYFRNAPMGSVSIGDYFGIFLSRFIVLGFIWVPLAIIAGIISRKKGFKASLWFVAASFFISAIVIGGCFGLIAR